ncbi:MAG: hypothetical protein FJ265_18255 [Planctomycetes bacterium]|nr:hypothetical protein [Planctomycetota bacterium]
MRVTRCVPLLLFALPGCGVWFFSGESWVDRSRPAVLVETTGGIEHGAATEFGVLTLGRTATDGPCRVHYFLGPTPLVESGTLAPAGGGFTQADIDLKTQAVRALDRAVAPGDRLVATWTADGTHTTEVAVELAAGPAAAGDLLAAGAVPLPAGAAVLRVGDDGALQFVGLVAGKATLEAPGGRTDYYVFAGVDRVRELLAVPRRHPVEVAPRHRPDDITVLKPVPEPPATAPATATQGPPK